MVAAVSEVNSDRLGLRESARLYNVPLETLRRRVKGMVTMDCRPGPKTVLTDEEEESKLAQYLLEMCDMGYGLNREGVMGLAYSIVERTRRPHPFKNGSAGRAWFEGFLRRHPKLTIRSPQSLSYCRAVSATKDTISDFFGKLGSLYGKLNLVLKPMQIFNCDETGITIVFKPGKVIAEVGKKHVYAISAAERGKTHTVLSCVSAAGYVVPPMMIYPRKTQVPDKMREGAFPSTFFKSSESGWVNSELFVEWFLFFLKSIPPARPVILIQDGHGSHVSIELIEIARENDVCLLCLPSHTSHILQPLDVGVFRSFKSNFNKACANYMKAHPGRVVTAEILASMVGQAYPAAFTPVNVLSGFKKTGIYPFNPSSIDVQQLAPSTALSDKARCTTVPEQPTSVDGRRSSETTVPEQPTSVDGRRSSETTVPEQPTSVDGRRSSETELETILFSPEKEELFAQWFDDGATSPELPLDYQPSAAPDGNLHEEYDAWMRINHPERCLSVDGRSTMSASSELTSSSSPPISVYQPSESDVLSDILVLPRPKEKSGRRRKAAVNKKTVCLTDDTVLEGLVTERQRKKDAEEDKTERRRIREEKKAKKEALKKEKKKEREQLQKERERKKKEREEEKRKKREQKGGAKRRGNRRRQNEKPEESASEEEQLILNMSALCDSDASSTSSDATCPTCGLFYGEDSSVWICCDTCETWFDLECSGCDPDNIPSDFVCKLCSK